MRTPEQFKAFLRSPFVGAAFPIAAIVIGLLASLYHERILSAWPFPWFDGGDFFARGPFVSEAAWFWGLIILFAILLTWREAIRASDNENIRSQYSERLNELKLLTETSPPRAFLGLYDELFGKAFDASTEAILGVRTQAGKFEESGDDDPLARTTRFVLDTMLQLARRWDSTTDVENISDRVYRANIMWCWSHDSITEESKKAEVLELSKLLYEFGDVDGLFKSVDGFLTVDQLLSTMESTDGVEDTEIEKLVLIFNKDTSQPTKNLAGAPDAVVSGKACYVNDTAEMSRFAKAARGFESEELQKIESYYETDGKGRSIISMPIVSQFDQSTAHLPLAIVNLYRDHKGIMGSKNRALQFAHLMVPFVSVLRNLITEIQTTSE